MHLLFRQIIIRTHTHPCGCKVPGRAWTIVSVEAVHEAEERSSPADEIYRRVRVLGCTWLARLQDIPLEQVRLDFGWMEGLGPGLRRAREAAMPSNVIVTVLPRWTKSRV
eukprot:2377059-Amphidinium_carterae.1